MRRPSITLRGVDEAIQRFTRILEQTPGNHLARFSLAKLLFDGGRFDEALGHFAKALEAKPDWMMARILLGKCHLSLGDRNSARGCFEEGLRLAIAQHHDGPQAEMEALLEDLA